MELIKKQSLKDGSTFKLKWALEVPNELNVFIPSGFKGTIIKSNGDGSYKAYFEYNQKQYLINLTEDKIDLEQ